MAPSLDIWAENGDAERIVPRQKKLSEKCYRARATEAPHLIEGGSMLYCCTKRKETIQQLSKMQIFSDVVILTERSVGRISRQDLARDICEMFAFPLRAGDLKVHFVQHDKLCFALDNIYIIAKRKAEANAPASFVGLPGLEPGKAGPESAVLPLHHSPIVYGCKGTAFFYYSKRFDDFLSIFLHFFLKKH